MSQESALPLGPHDGDSGQGRPHFLKNGGGFDRRDPQPLGKSPRRPGAGGKPALPDTAADADPASSSLNDLPKLQVTFPRNIPTRSL